MEWMVDWPRFVRGLDGGALNTTVDTKIVDLFYEYPTDFAVHVFWEG